MDYCINETGDVIVSLSLWKKEYDVLSKRPGKVGVVLTGGDFQGLGVLRTFGEKNIPMVLVDSEHCIAKYSRYKKRFFPSPNPADEENYTEFLVELSRRHGLEGWVLFPNSDQIVKVLSRNREAL